MNRKSRCNPVPCPAKCERFGNGSWLKRPTRSEEDGSHVSVSLNCGTGRVCPPRPLAGDLTNGGADAYSGVQPRPTMVEAAIQIRYCEPLYID